MTLLEVLVSILIFSIGLLGTVALQARATQFATTAEDRTRAALLANELAAEMWTRGTADPNADATLKGIVDDWEDRVGDIERGGIADGAANVSFLNGVATIEVTWGRPSFSNGASAPARGESSYQTQVAIPAGTVIANSP